MEFDKEFWTTLFFTIINILVLYFILKKLLFKRVTNFMDNRTNKIDEALKMADEAKSKLATMEEEHHKKLKEIKNEGSLLMKDYEKKANEEYNSIIEKAKKESELLVKNTREELETEKEQLVSELKEDIISLVLETSEKVLEKNIDDKDNRKLIQDLIDSGK